MPMKTIASSSFLKMAASFDDQPGFVNRDQGHSPFGVLPQRANEGDQVIIDRWDDKKKKKKKQPKMKQIYQLGISVPESPREEKARISHGSERSIKTAYRNNS